MQITIRLKESKTAAPYPGTAFVFFLASAYNFARFNWLGRRAPRLTTRHCAEPD
ncbi:MAG: hypothetical protein KDI01_02815 [Halioglobus sp.]|nr:hypothetical protein [Halioglobus sp.]